MLVACYFQNYVSFAKDDWDLKNRTVTLLCRPDYDLYGFKKNRKETELHFSELLKNVTVQPMSPTQYDLFEMVTGSITVEYEKHGGGCGKPEWHRVLQFFENYFTVLHAEPSKQRCVFYRPCSCIVAYSHQSLTAEVYRLTESTFVWKGHDNWNEGYIFVGCVDTEQSLLTCIEMLEIDKMYSSEQNCVVEMRTIPLKFLTDIVSLIEQRSKVLSYSRA